MKEARTDGEETKIEKVAPKPKSKREIRFNRYTEKARYDGRTQYEKPKYSYNYNYRYNHIDTSQSIGQVMYQWFVQTRTNMGEFLLDMTFR